MALARHSEVFQDRAGNALVGLRCKLQTAGGDAVPIFSDSAGAAPIEGNVVTTTSQVLEAVFYVAPGTYSRLTMAAGATTWTTEPDVAIGIGAAGSVAAADITDSTATGRALIKAASAAAARAAIGAAATATDVGLGNADNTSDLDKPISTATQTALTGKEDIINRGAANGYATLDSGGKVLAAQLPLNGSLLGAWNASTNTPTLVNGTGTNGDTYDVTVAGTQNLGSGSITFAVQDRIKYDAGTGIWYRLANATSAVASAIAMTPVGGVAATNVQAGIEELDTEKAPKASPTFSGFIQGDLSNSTQASRLLFKTSTANANSSLGVVPNGTGTTANVRLFNNSTPTDASTAQLSVTNSSAFLVSSRTGSGTYLPLALQTSDVTALTIAVDQKVTIPLLQFTPAGTGAVIRSQQDKTRDIVCIFDFMTSAQVAACQAATSYSTSVDVTTAFQKFVDYLQINGKAGYVPQGHYCLTSVITVASGTGPTIYGSTPQRVNSTGVPSGGTWLYFAHTGKGVTMSSVDGANFFDFGTYRLQPTPSNTPGTPWTPTAHDFDFYMAGCVDINYDGTFLLNPTKGITLVGAGGRINILNTRLQALSKGIVIERALDTCRLDHIHTWPFWSSNSNVSDYTLANAVAYEFQAVDNPLMSNCFAISYFKSLRFVNDSGGLFTQRIKVVNCDFDASFYGIAVEGDNVSGHFDNVSVLCVAVGNTCPLIVVGSNADLQFGNLKLDQSRTNAILVNGNNNQLRIGSLSVNEWDTSNAGWYAIQVAAGAPANNLTLATVPYFLTASKTSLYFGKISVDAWQDITPACSASTGSGFTIGAVAQWKLVGKTVSFKGTVTNYANGTGASSWRVTTPVYAPAQRSIGTGKEIATSGTGCTVSANPAGFLDITTVGNAYPGGTGSVVDFYVEYQTA